MCEPTTVMLAVTAVMGAVSYKQQKDSADYQEKVAKQNAEVMENQAADARARGVIEAEQKRDEIRQLSARQAVGLAGNGLDLASGTSLDLFEETAQLGEYDIQAVRANAAREAFGYEAQATNSLQQASAARAAGKNAGTSTLLTTVAKGAGQYYGMNPTSTSAGTYSGGTVGNLYG